MPEDGKANLGWLKQRLSPLRVRLKRADSARDGGDWNRAAAIYRDLWLESPEREGLLIQSANCAKEAGCAPDALGAYLNVSQAGLRTEAALQLGHLLKVTGNAAAASACYDWSARNGNAFAAGEREALAERSGGTLRQGFYRRGASSLTQNPLEFVASLSAAERWPLDCVQLAHAAQTAAIEGLETEGEILAELALIVGGPSNERRSWYETWLQGLGLRLRPLSSAPGPLHESEQTALSAPLLSSLEPGAATPGPPIAASAHFPTWPGDHLIVLEPELAEAQAEAAKRRQDLARLREALFDSAHSDPRDAVEAFVDAALADGGGPYVNIPNETGVFSPKLLARRVALNCTRALARRLAASLRATASQPSHLASLFWISTGVASAATNHDWDRPPASAAATAPLPAEPARSFGEERFEILQIGRLQASAGDADVPRLTGVIAIRTRSISAEAALGLRVRLNGRTIDHVEPSCAGTDSAGRSMFFFNSWINTVDLPRGMAELQLDVEFRSSVYTAHKTWVLIDHELPQDAYPESDGFVTGVPSASGDDLVEAVAALPEMVREATRRAFSGRIASVLVMRLDQLGDLAASLAGMRRLKQMFPDATFEALVTPANAPLARSTGLFDVVTGVDFPYDHGTRRRHLSRMDELALRSRYASKPIDLAIDLSPGMDSRPVLKLVNATWSAGFKPREFEFLDFGVDLITRDPVNRKENISHTAMINTLVEAIGAAVSPPPERFALPESSRAHLARYGLEARDYVVLHSGARLAIKRWPLDNYVELTRLIREQTQRPVVFFSDDPLPEATARTLRQDPGVIVFEGRMDFDALDAVIGNARLFIGNDTGPKHLAAVRGVFTVSIHMDQVNWNEWGQDGEGYIISRRVPCCGCGIEVPSECGKDMACLVQIRPGAVADAALSALQQPSEARGAWAKSKTPKIAAG